MRDSPLAVECGDKRIVVDFGISQRSVDALKSDDDLTL
jgi:hypothetical protein